MNKLEKKYNRLLEQYSDLQDEMLLLNPSMYDAMYYDIRGFSCIEEEEWEYLITDLEKQVKAFKMIVNGLKMVNYTFC